MSNQYSLATKAVQFIIAYHGACKFVFAIGIQTSLAPIAFFGFGMGSHFVFLQDSFKRTNAICEALHESHPFIGSLGYEFPQVSIN